MALDRLGADDGLDTVEEMESPKPPVMRKFPKSADVDKAVRALKGKPIGTSIVISGAIAETYALIVNALGVHGLHADIQTQYHTMPKEYPRAIEYTYTVKVTSLSA